MNSFNGGYCIYRRYIIVFVGGSSQISEMGAVLKVVSNTPENMLEG